MSNQLRAPDESEAMVYNEIVRAARAGEPCPSNTMLCAVLGATSVATPSRLMKRLAARGRITIKGFANGREVFIHEIGLTLLSASSRRFLDQGETPPPRREMAEPTMAVFREPCFRCGVRADVGCEHTPDWAKSINQGA
jgi:hypothetical protein